VSPAGNTDVTIAKARAGPAPMASARVVLAVSQAVRLKRFVKSGCDSPSYG
jgi:hypothetical protein